MRTIKLLLSFVVAFYLVGCATPASQQAMTIGISDVPTQLNPNLKNGLSVVGVTGGKETSPLWTSQVDNSGFRSALEQSLLAVGYLTSTNNSKFKVEAELIELKQPFMGLNFDVVSTVKYKISNQIGTEVFPITATGTATFSDSAIGIERLRIANEKSIKENIKQFIQKISDFYKR
jgi:hypothetical protein